MKKRKKTNIIGKIMLAMIVCLMALPTIHAEGSGSTTTSPEELYSVKEIGVTVKPLKKHEDGLILKGDEVDVFPSISINITEYLKSKNVSEPAEDKVHLSGILTLQGDSYVYSEKRDNRFEIDKYSGSKIISVQLENHGTLVYAGDGSKIHLAGALTLSYDTFDSITINVDETFDAEELGGVKELDPAELKKDLLVPNYTLSVEKIKKDTPFDIDINVVDPNIKYTELTTKELKDAYVLLNSTTFNASNKIGRISNLRKNEQGYLQYTVSFTNVYWINDASATNSLDFNISYSGRVWRSGIGKEFNQDKNVSVKLFEMSDKETNTDEDVLIPNLIITKYNGISNITAGSSATISITFTNTSATTAIDNLVFTVDGGEAFAITSGVNKFYLETLAPKETYTLTITLNCKKSVTVGSYKISIDADGQYGEEGKLFKAANDLTIPVTQVDRTRINYVKMSNVYTNSEGEVNYSILNNGLADIYNVNIEIYDGETMLESLYIGSIAASKEAKGTNIYLTFAEEGSKVLTMRVTYEDENFNQMELKQDFEVYVQSNNWGWDEPVWEEPIVEPIEEPKKNTTLYIGLGVGAIAVIAGIIFYRKKKKNKGMIDDEDL